MPTPNDTAAAAAHVTPRVPTTTLGDTGLEVSVLGLGLAALGRPAYLNLGHAEDLGEPRTRAALERRTHAMLDAAASRGVTYVDAARSYGAAEDFVHSWMMQPGRTDSARVLVGSKWGYVYVGDWRLDAERHEVKDHRIEVFETQLVESRERLGSRLVLYQVHSATLESGVLDDATVCKRLAALRDEGMHVGLTVSGSHQAEVVERALRLRHGTQPLFETVQATWNLLERSAETALRRAHDAGVGIIIKEPLANGRLGPRNREPAFAARAARLDAVCRELGISRDALAIAAALARPWRHVVLSGAVRVEHFHSNAAALAVDWSPDLERALRPLEEPAPEYWETRSHLPWN